MFVITHPFKGHVRVFAGQVKIVSHSYGRTSAILKYVCPLFQITGIGRRRLLDGWLRSVRYCSTIEAVQTVVDKSTLSKLRKKTGFPLLNCKKALEKFDNDIKQVIHAGLTLPLAIVAICYLNVEWLQI